jgi:hypothetical protein
VENADARDTGPLFIFANSTIEKLHVEYNSMEREATRRILIRETMASRD